MKVKVFSMGFVHLPDVLETEINKWLAKHPNIEIKSETACSCTGVNVQDSVFVNVTYIIRYEERA